jgi:hypothetical protein
MNISYFPTARRLLLPGLFAWISIVFATVAGKNPSLPRGAGEPDSPLTESPAQDMNPSDFK